MEIAVIAVPYDAGQRGVGVGLGPARLLEAGLANQLRNSGHDVREWSIELPADTASHEMARVAAIQRELGHAIRIAVSRGELPIVLAGNCSTAVGTLAAAPAGTAVVWFDAHGDFNTADTTETGMLDGLALSMVTGRALRALTAGVSGFVPVDESRVLLVGARDLDEAEEQALAASRVARIAADIAPCAVRDTLRGLSPPARHTYVHLDLDVLDPAHARANRYNPPGGLTPAALAQTLAAIADVTSVYAIAVTAYDPAWDRDGATRQAATHAINALLPPPDRE